MRRMRAWRQSLSGAEAAQWIANGAAGMDLREFTGLQGRCLQLEAQLVAAQKEGEWHSQGGFTGSSTAKFQGHLPANTPKPFITGAATNLIPPPPL